MNRQLNAKTHDSEAKPINQRSVSSVQSFAKTSQLNAAQCVWHDLQKNCPEKMCGTMSSQGERNSRLS